MRDRIRERNVARQYRRIAKKNFLVSNLVKESIMGFKGHTHRLKLELKTSRAHLKQPRTLK